MSKISLLITCLIFLLCFGCARTVIQEEPCIPCQPPIIEQPAAPRPILPNPCPDDPPYISSTAPLIVIDPGHGGKDFGTQASLDPKYDEKSLNLATAKLLRQYLQNMGYRTAMTRKEDVFVALDKRAQFANSLNPKLFVSVHYNSAPAEKAQGVEVFYYNSEMDKTRATASKALAGNILAQVINNTQAKSRGVKHGNLAVIRETNMPAILIEGGFLSNPSERQKLLDPAYIKRVAQGIAKGIDNYIKGVTPSS